MIQAPLVSVIMCVYNAGQYLRSAVQSVLAQTHRNLELLIVDDGSTDACMETISDIRDQRIRMIHQENQGKPVAMNVALAEMRGEFYALNDADDLSDPARIERQLTCLRENPDVAAVYCGLDLILNNRRMAPLAQAKDRAQCHRDIDAFRMPGHDPTGMYRTSLVRDIRYEPSLPIVEGLDYVLRVGERHPMLVVGECLYTYRIHAESVTKRDPELRDRLVREVLRRACQRRGLDFAMVFPNGADSRPSRNRDRDNNLAAHFMDSVCDLKAAGRYWEAIRTAAICSSLHPFDAHYHKAMVYALSPSWLVRCLRRSFTRVVPMSS